MPLVHVMDRRLDPELFQSPQTANAQYDLLPDPLMDISAVKLVGDFSILNGPVLWNVCVHQIQLHPPDVDPPYLNENFARGQRDADDHLFPKLANTRPNRKRVEIVQWRTLLLPAVRIQVLLEITALVK